ncbi:MAG: response regulator, partial [Firmicutes bacterium]|nr:response regulator [Bacillota bacterium]
DTGIGMTPEFMETMWDSFSRATDTRINKIQGAGLGLNIVKKLVDMMGGTIEVESEINKGSTFTVRLPLKPVEHVVSAELDSDIDLEVLDVNVLLAEDNDMNWEIAQELLGLSGITCTRAVNGEECLEMFTESPEGTYDAIFMDMQMPVMDGVEATKRIRGSQHPEAKTIPILAMTANAFTEDIETCKAAGMNDHFSKPIDVAKVVAAMKKYIKK